jgi:hypothetical protein
MIEPVQLHYGEQEPHPNGSKYPLYDESGDEVGIVLGDDLAGTWSGTLYREGMIGFWSFRRDQVLTMCGLWLAYQESIKTL